MRDLAEAVARQLCELDGKDPDHRPPFGSGMPGRKPPRWMLYEHVAQAVIDTVRAHDKADSETQA
jgi:hypothetical protein